MRFWKAIARPQAALVPPPSRGFLSDLVFGCRDTHSTVLRAAQTCATRPDMRSTDALGSGSPPRSPKSARTVRRFASGIQVRMELGGQWCPPSRTARVKSVHAVVGVSARPEMAAVTPPRCRGRLWVSKKIQLCLGAESLPTRSSVPDACTRLSKSKITPVVPRKLRFKPAQRPCTAIIPFGQPSCLQWVRKG